MRFWIRRRYAAGADAAIVTFRGSGQAANGCLLYSNPESEPGLKLIANGWLTVSVSGAYLSVQGVFVAVEDPGAGVLAAWYSPAARVGYLPPGYHYPARRMRSWRGPK
jgi:hypothetical protein